MRASLIEHVSAEKPIVLRDVVVDSTGRELLAGDVLRRKRPDAGVRTDGRTVGRWEKRQVRNNERVHGDVDRLPGGIVDMTFPRRLCRHRIDDRYAERLPNAFVIEECERLVLLDGCADRDTILMSIERRLLPDVEVIARVQGAVTPEIVGVAVHGVGARPG